MKHVLITFIVFMLSLLMLAFVYYESIAPTKQNATFIIAPGESVRHIAFAMQDQGIIQDPYGFIFLAEIHRHANAIKAGEYEIQKDTPIIQIIEQMVRGDVVMHDLRIGEGWTFAQLAAQIKDEEAIKKTLDWSSTDTMLQQLSLGEGSPEGLFYPDTYFFARGYTDKEFLIHAYNRMQNFLNNAWANRSADLPYTSAYQALIAASIIEKETAVAAERGEISGVIVRRLQEGMRLQLDPTVVYGLGASYNGFLTVDDLKRDTPYNTYLHDGLPPTPIAIPSAESITAAMQPKPGVSLYFVANGDGSHTFSKTLEEHNEAVKLYRELQKQ
jgi:UPF0755 protein